jgi:hypothetical protein
MAERITETAWVPRVRMNAIGASVGRGRARRHREARDHRKGENEALGEHSKAGAGGGFLAPVKMRGSILQIALRKPGSCAPGQIFDTFRIDAVGGHQGPDDRVGERLRHVARELGRDGRGYPFGR